MTIISSETPLIPDLPAGRYRVSMVFSDGRMGNCSLITTAGHLDFTTRDFRADQIITHKGGSVALLTSPHIHGRRAPSVTLSITEEL
jgi:hypothetical protein